MPQMPFALRRPVLLMRDLVVDRGRPDLEALGRLTDPERFLWAILPHAARTFSASIALLPAASARASAVAYLYCRMLDTYEDLVLDRPERLAALHAFAERFDHPEADGRLPPAPSLQATVSDAADRAHVLLVERCVLVDRVRATLSPDVQDIIRDLVCDMAAGMAWGAETFDSQGGVLSDEPQLMRYCREVLGNPVVYIARLSKLRRGGPPDLTPDEREAALLAGEFVQLANVTRDIEKDLRRNVAYHPSLRGDLGLDVPRPSARLGDETPAAREAASKVGAETGAVTATPGKRDAVVERVRLVRKELLGLALMRAPAFGELIGMLDGGLMRGSATLMLLFSDRHYRGCATRVGRPTWGPRVSGLRLLASSLMAMASRRWTRRVVDRAVADMTRAAEELGHASPAEQRAV